MPILLFAQSTQGALDDIRRQIEGVLPFFDTVSGRLIWAGGVLLAGYVAGLLLAMITKRIGRRLHPVGETLQKETPLLDMISAFMRICLMGLAMLVAADAIGMNTIATARNIGKNVVIAFIILIGAWYLSNWFARSIRDFGEKAAKRSTRADQTLFSFLASLLKYGVMAVAIVFALTQFGFNTNSLVAVVGAAGLAIALALQDTLKAVAAGVMLAFFRPYRIGDWIILSEQEGSVTDINPFTTTFMTIDNKAVVIPNDLAWGNVIVNATAKRQRRLDLIISISYDDNIDHAMKVLEDTLKADPRIASEPPVWVGVHALASWSVDLRVRGWCPTDQFVQVKSDSLKAMKQAFDANGVTIPYPHQVEIFQQTRNTPPHIHATKADPGQLPDIDSDE